MYRLSSTDDLFDIGWEDYLARGGVCAVEWSENVTEAMEGAVSVTIDVLGENTRRITISGGIFLLILAFETSAKGLFGGAAGGRNGFWRKATRTPA